MFKTLYPYTFHMCTLGSKLVVFLSYVHGYVRSVIDYKSLFFFVIGTYMPLSNNIIYYVNVVAVPDLI